MRFNKWIIPAALAASLAGGLAIAQGVMPFQHQMPTPESMQRLQDGEIAGVIAALKMTDEQLKLWAPVEQSIRAQQAERLKAFQDFAAATKDGTAAPAPVSVPDRLDRMSDRMAKRAEQMKSFVTSFKPFYATLSDAQKAVAGPLLAHLERGGMDHGRGHGFGHHGGHGDQSGGMPL